jgi:hypothetical protein
MTEPTSSSVAVVGAALSSALVSLIGLEYHALMGAAFGAFLTLTMTDDVMTRRKAIMTFFACAVCGAAFGAWVTELLTSGSRAALVGISMICGAGAQVLVPAAIARGVRMLNAGKKGGGE